MVKKRLRIFLSLILSLSIVLTLSNKLFIANSPKINQAFLSNLPQKANYFLSKLTIKTNSTKHIKQKTKNKKNLSPGEINFSSLKQTATPIATKTIPKKKEIPTKAVYTNQNPPPPITSPSMVTKKRLSNSKLGIFILATLSTGAKKIITTGPRIIKFIDPQYNNTFMDEIKKYKNDYPNGIVLLRFWEGTENLKYSSTDDPVASAEDFFNKVNSPNLKKLGLNIGFFDYLQTPNEFENTPDWNGKENISWNGKFWQKLTELNKSYHIKTCIGGIPVGNINPSDLGFILENLKKMQQLGAAFCYHSYSFNYLTDPNQEIQLSLRYRQFYNYFKIHSPELLSMPLILSEGGVAEDGNPKAGYRISNSIDKYKNWLKWYDKEIRKDSYVVGVTLFQIGNDSDWRYFNLEPISNWLANYINSNK